MLVCTSIVLAKMLQDFIPPSSFLRHTFFMDLSLGDRVFYTRSNGVRVPATVVGMAEMGSSTWSTTKMHYGWCIANARWSPCVLS